MVTHLDQIKTALHYFNISAKFVTTKAIKLTNPSDFTSAYTLCSSLDMSLVTIDYGKCNQADLTKFLDYTKDILTCLGWSEEDHTILRFNDTNAHLRSY